MFQVFDKTNFNDISFVSKLNENGFDIHNVGGEENSDFSTGDVLKLKSGQYQLIGSDTVILTCSANVFFKTLTDVESKLNFRLFG
ncbi:MAG: hypothetical protein VW397_03645 [Candidatus Margulisiibacteriota bacterium]